MGVVCFDEVVPGCLGEAVAIDEDVGDVCDDEVVFGHRGVGVPEEGISLFSAGLLVGGIDFAFDTFPEVAFFAGIGGEGVDAASDDIVFDVDSSELFGEHWFRLGSVFASYIFGCAAGLADYSMVEGCAV